MTFDHQLFPRTELETEFLKNGKFYNLPTGEKLPSVTTVLGKYYDKKKGLAKWKKRIGEEEAAKVLKQAGNRGTAIHDLAEKYLLNEPDWALGAMPMNLMQFKDIRNLLDKHVGTVYGVEFPVSHRTLKTAGTIDLLAQWDGTPAVIDFKTSKWPKKEEWIESYFVQASIYAIMADGVSPGPNFRKIVIVLLIDHETPIIYERCPYHYLDKIQEIFIDNRKE